VGTLPSEGGTRPLDQVEFPAGKKRRVRQKADPLPLIKGGKRHRLRWQREGRKIAHSGRYQPGGSGPTPMETHDREKRPNEGRRTKLSEKGGDCCRRGGGARKRGKLVDVVMGKRFANGKGDEPKNGRTGGEGLLSSLLFPETPKTGEKTEVSGARTDQTGAGGEKDQFSQ